MYLETLRIHPSWTSPASLQWFETLNIWIYPDELVLDWMTL
jgi:hypothetical protein